MNNARYIIQVSKGIIRERRVRRSVMSAGLVVAAALAFLGAWLLDGWLREHVVAFLFYWGACVWVTVLVLLLALYDMLAVRAEWRREKRRLERESMERSDEDAR